MPFVYFFTDDQELVHNPEVLHVKIGVSKNIEKRRRQLQTGNVAELKVMGWIEVPDARALEASLHQKYAADRERGEWFVLTPASVRAELAQTSRDGYLAVGADAYQIVGRDEHGWPEYASPWPWGDIRPEEFCPQCGSNRGVHYDSQHLSPLCLYCGPIADEPDDDA